MKQFHLSIVGFGTVGQGLAELLVSKQDMLRANYDLEVVLAGVATAHSGFIYREDGLNIPLLLELAANRRPLQEHPEVKHWDTALEGIEAVGQWGDILAEVTGTNLRDAEPGISHMRVALSRGMHVITANKGPGALAAAELFALAQEHGVQLRMEATVMAGTPVLSTIREGMAGVHVTAIRGILNGTTNYILSAMATGRSYSEALAEAQAHGYAEADPTADVEGYDAVAKTLILASLVFGQSLRLEQVVRQGITTITPEQMQKARDSGKRIKLIAALTQKEGTLEARVAPVELPLSDPLARVDGVMNAITISSDSLTEVTVIGPGAGKLVTGQGLLADLIAIAQSK